MQFLVVQRPTVAGSFRLLGQEFDCSPESPAEASHRYSPGNPQNPTAPPFDLPLLYGLFISTPGHLNLRFSLNTPTLVHYNQPPRLALYHPIPCTSAPDYLPPHFR